MQMGTARAPMGMPRAHETGSGHRLSGRTYVRDVPLLPYRIYIGGKGVSACRLLRTTGPSYFTAAVVVVLHSKKGWVLENDERRFGVGNV